MDFQEMDAPAAEQLRVYLLGMARRQDELAAKKAAGVPYWSPCPSAVVGHRAAAEALRAEAEGPLVTT